MMDYGYSLDFNLVYVFGIFGILILLFGFNF